MTSNFTLGREFTAKEQRSIEGNGMFSDLIVAMYPIVYTCQKQKTVHLKRMQFTVCKLYLNESDVEENTRVHLSNL